MRDQIIISVHSQSDNLISHLELCSVCQLETHTHTPSERESLTVQERQIIEASEPSFSIDDQIIYADSQLRQFNKTAAKVQKQLVGNRKRGVMRMPKQLMGILQRNLREARDSHRVHLVR